MVRVHVDVHDRVLMVHVVLSLGMTLSDQVSVWFQPWLVRSNVNETRVQTQHGSFAVEKIKHTWLAVHMWLCTLYCMCMDL